MMVATIIEYDTERMTHYKHASLRLTQTVPFTQQRFQFQLREVVSHDSV